MLPFSYHLQQVNILIMGYILVSIFNKFCLMKTDFESGMCKGRELGFLVLFIAHSL